MTGHHVVRQRARDLTKYKQAHPKASERFLALVKVNRGHRLWAGATSKGQPSFSYRGGTVRARRVAWLLHRGAWPSEHSVITSTCPDPLCVDARHLVSLSRGAMLAAARELRARLDGTAQARLRTCIRCFTITLDVLRRRDIHGGPALCPACYGSPT